MRIDKPTLTDIPTATAAADDKVIILDTDDSDATKTITTQAVADLAASSLTAGSVVFSNGSNLAQDNANLFWDDTNNRLGIGTASPSNPFHAKANPAGTTAVAHIETTATGDQDLLLLTYAGVNAASELLKINNSGGTIFNVKGNGTTEMSGDLTVDTNTLYVDASANRVGIGTTSPSDQLEIQGTTAAGMAITNTGSGSVDVNFDANRTGAGTYIGTLSAKWDGTAVARIVFLSGDDTVNKDNASMTFMTASAGTVAEAMRINPDGNVGIGVTDPDEILDIDGALCIKDGMTAPSTHSGKASIYVDSADGDLKVKFGDGTVKTISTDT